MTTPDTSKIANLKDLYPPSTLLGNLMLVNDPSNTLTHSSAVSAWTALEINYQRSGGRKPFTTPADAAYVIDGSFAVAPVAITFSNLMGWEGMQFTKAAVIDSSPKIVAVFEYNVTIPIRDIATLNLILKTY